MNKNFLSIIRPLIRPGVFGLLSICVWAVSLAHWGTALVAFGASHIGLLLIAVVMLKRGESVSSVLTDVFGEYFVFLVVASITMFTTSIGLSVILMVIAIYVFRLYLLAWLQSGK